MTRKLLAAAAAAVVAAACAGCVQITDERSEQLDLIGDVSVVTSLCTEGVEIDARRSTGECGYNELGRAQLLLAYRIPAGSEPVGAPALGLPMHEDAAFAEQLAAREPGRWVAYASEPRDFGMTRLRDEVTARFTLGEGAPYRGPFPFRTVVGYRHEGSDEVTDETDTRQPTRDLAILPGDEPTIEAGTTGRVPFRAVFAGADHEDLDFTLTTDSGTPESETFHPEPDGETGLNAVVKVPDDTAPGRHAISLTAKLANGQSRSGTATYRVIAGAAPAEPAVEARPDVTQPAAQPRLTTVASRRCLSRRTVRIRLRAGGRRDVRTVRVNGKPTPFRTKGRTTLLVDLRGLPKHRYAIRISARLSDRTVITDPRRYRTCTPKMRSRLPVLRRAERGGDRVLAQVAQRVQQRADDR